MCREAGSLRGRQSGLINTKCLMDRRNIEVGGQSRDLGAGVPMTLPVKLQRRQAFGVQTWRQGSGSELARARPSVPSKFKSTYVRFSGHFCGETLYKHQVL